MVFSGAPEKDRERVPYPYRKTKETHKLIFSWLSWLAVLLVGAWARTRDDDGDDGVAQHGGHNRKEAKFTFVDFFSGSAPSIAGLMKERT